MLLSTRSRTSRRAGQQRAARLLVSPALAVLSGCVIIPLVLAAVLSLTRYDLLAPPRFVGLANYTALLSDPVFYKAVGNTVFFAVGQVLVGVVVALGVAMLFNRHIAGGAVMRTVIYLPQAMSYVTVALLWSFLYDPYSGPISSFIEFLGGPRIHFLTDANLAMPSIMVMSLWRNMGYFMIILLAGLKAIPPELPEAAAVDGANAFQRLIHITVPQLASPLLFVCVTWFLGGLQMFTQAYVMTGGGPANATRTVVFELYQSAFRDLDIGRASAVGVLLFTTVMAVALPLRLYGYIRERRERRA